MSKDQALQDFQNKLQAARQGQAEAEAAAAEELYTAGVKDGSPVIDASADEQAKINAAVEAKRLEMQAVIDQEKADLGKMKADLDKAQADDQADKAQIADLGAKIQAKDELLTKIDAILHPAPAAPQAPAPAPAP